MNRSDERLGILHTERVDPWAIGLSQPRTAEMSNWVIFLGMIPVPKLNARRKMLIALLYVFLLQCLLSAISTNSEYLTRWNRD